MEGIKKWEVINNKIYELRDYGVRNIVVVGAYYANNESYKQTVDVLLKEFELPGNIVFNNYLPLWLIALT